MKGYKFITNKISVVILVGIAGFVFSICLLGGKNKENRIVYHELLIPQKDSILRVIYHSRLVRLKDSLKVILPGTTNDLKRVEMRTKIANMLADSANFTANNADTADTFFTKTLLINRTALGGAMSSDSFNVFPYPHKSIFFLYNDTNAMFRKEPAYNPVKSYIAVSNPRTMMEFIQRNTLAGLWLILSVAQMILWFLVIPVLYGRIDSLNEQVKNLPGDLFSVVNWLISSIIPLLFLGLFSYIFYERMIDTTIIRDNYFLEGFNTKMLWYAVIGYLVAAGCFGMFLHMSMCLDQLDQHVRTNKMVMANDQELKDNYAAIKNAFDDSFLATAVILSVFVLWLGAAFTAINHTEAMRFYKIYAGTDFLSADYVYLVGAFHTVVLLLFYIPVKLKFSSLAIAGQAQNVIAPGGNKILGNLWSSITTILVTASPLLASLIQKLLSGMVGN